MFRIVAFILMIVGGVNWFTIGTLQYDFVAGIFGLQSNIFSRIIYAMVGVATLYILVVTMFNKGRLKLFGYKKKPRKEPEDDF